MRTKARPSPPNGALSLRCVVARLIHTHDLHCNPCQTAPPGRATSNASIQSRDLGCSVLAVATP
eukprot:12898020-Prorocentrum_lima.AAC.1